MPRFSVNIDFLFREYPLLERLAAARDAGFLAVEIPWPYLMRLDDLDQARRAAQVEIVEINIPAGDLLDGGYGIACVPGREKEFEKALKTGLEWALRLDCKRLNILAGYQPPWASREHATETYVRNLAYAADRSAEHGITLLVEACNRRERPNYLVGTSNEALAIVQGAARSNVKIEHDLYHLQIAEGDLMDRIRKIHDFIGHIQFADVPGRHEPGTGEINYASVFAAIDQLGFKGWCGAEYYPTTQRTADSLHWFEPYRAAQTR